MKPMNQAHTARARERRQAARGKTALRIFALLFGLLVAAPAFALNAIRNTATDVPVTASGYTASGTVTFTLNFAPSAGTNLTVVSNTAAGFITGTFSNLTRGQAVTLTYGGGNYRFVANYNGGTGNDLVLQWANARPAAWGYNAYGQLGDNTTTNRLISVNVLTTGALAGKTVIAQAAGALHSVALCSDGTVAAWGRGYEGQLGNNTANNSSVPVAVNTSGVLAGKTVIAVAAGNAHSLALCSDGTLAAWGDNSRGQLGNNSTTSSTVPVAVSTSGVLAGKTVVAVAAGIQHSLVLCSDGTMAAWGDNTYHQLGNDAFNSSLLPVVVSSSPLAAGERYAATFGGPAAYHSLGLIASPPAPPVVITLAFTNLTFSGVTLNGTVNPGGSATAASFEYGTGVSYGSTVSVTLSPNNGTTAQNVSASLTGLAPETLYHYRLAATNIDGTVSTGDGTFTTHLSPLENWRLQWFGSNANSGPGADDADPNGNGNGIPNLLEYAFGGDPLGSATGVGLLPQAATGAANTLQIAFTRYLDRNDLTLTVKAADSLLGPWADLAQSALGGAFVILQPGATAPETGAGNTRTVTVTDIYQVSDPLHPRRFIKLEVTR